MGGAPRATEHLRTRSGLVSGEGQLRGRDPGLGAECQSTDTVPIAKHDDVRSSERKSMFAGMALQRAANVVPRCRMVTSADFIGTPSKITD